MAAGGTGGVGLAGAGGVAVGGSPALITEQSFELSWEDQFDTVEPTRWSQMTHTWDGNLAQFSTTNTVSENGILKLNLTAAPQGTTKPYLGVEYRSVDTLTFGKVEARIRFAKGSAVVSSLVLIYTPWPPDDWNELDVECLGNTTGDIQVNHMINIAPADPVSGHRQYPKLVDLALDPTAAFHDYAIEWVPGLARFSVDGVVFHEATEEMSRMVLPQNILLTIWASNAAGWAGAVDATTAPTSADYDWIRVYRYTGL
jgi:endo-1,3-1,4-beta-glycanase ExoK